MHPDDVLAVFDVDGTLVETNVVEYYFWMRLKAQPLQDWPGFMAEMLRKGPRWLYLERRSRAEFQRSFRFNVQAPRDVGDDEKQITDFFADVSVITLAVRVSMKRNRLTQFVDLFL